MPRNPRKLSGRKGVTKMADCERCRHHGRCITETATAASGGECKLFAPSGDKPGENAFELPVKVALTFADGKIITYRRG